METKRLRRIKPQPVPPRRLPWRRPRGLPPRPQSAYEEVTKLLDQFAHAGRFRHPLLSRRAANAFSVVLALVGAVITFPKLQIPSPLFILDLLTIGLLVSLLRMCLTNSETQLRIARQLSGADDLQAIPALTRVLYWPERGARNAAACALIRMLPRLRDTDSTPLDRVTCSLLRKQLAPIKAQRHPELAGVIRQALEGSVDFNKGEAITSL